jgi:hypothetical protein
MQFDECFEGDYRIFVGALDAPRGDGFIAAVVVSRLLLDGHDERDVTGEQSEFDDMDGAGAAAGSAARAARSPHAPHAPHAPRAPRAYAAPGRGRTREVWRDDSLACGYRWPTAEAALHYAKNRAREMVRKASPMLA